MSATSSSDAIRLTGIRDALPSSTSSRETPRRSATWSASPPGECHIDPATAPGVTELTRTPSSAQRSANTRESDTCAAFVTEYAGSRLPEGRRAAEEARLTILPPPACAMSGAAARMRRIDAITCSSHSSCQTASSVSSNVVVWATPALLTSAQGSPNASRHAATARSPASASVTSSARAIARPPTATHSAAASASAPSSRPISTAPAPSAHRPRAVARPMPRLAPETMHALPSSPRSITGMMRDRDVRRQRREPAPMKSHTVHKTFNTEERRAFVRITEDVQAAVDDSGVAEGMVLVSAMHITAGVWVNDDEPGIQADTLEWLDKLAPPSWKEPANDVARQLLPDPGDYRHHRGGEDNGDAHLKNLLTHQQVVLPITEGRLDLGPWQAVFYTEFDGRRPKRLVIKVIGE